MCIRDSPGGDEIIETESLTIPPPISRSYSEIPVIIRSFTFVLTDLSRFAPPVLSGA